jgi:hypothetical protein
VIEGSGKRRTADGYRSVGKGNLCFVVVEPRICNPVETQHGLCDPITISRGKKESEQLANGRTGIVMSGRRRGTEMLPTCSVQYLKMEGFLAIRPPFRVCEGVGKREGSWYERRLVGVSASADHASRGR